MILNAMHEMGMVYNDVYTTEAQYGDYAEDVPEELLNSNDGKKAN
jgi:hypothetical protein